MQKIIHPCNMPTPSAYPVFCKIEFSEDGRLSISGVIGPMRSGNAKGGCGQIEMEFDHANPAHNDSRYEHLIKASKLTFTAGWNRAKWYKFLEYWHDWHLNDMRSGCEHQRAMGWTYEDHHGVYEPDTKIIIDEYDTGEQIMKFNKYKGEACPICGYSIGSAWLKEEVPQEVIDFLFSLPDTDITPAWV